VEDDQLVEQGVEEDGPAETGNFTLFNDIRHRRDGTGETRRTLSWIWLATSSTDDSDSAGDQILRVEWAKSRAHAARAKEEVLLLREEMRRVLEFLEWKATWWTAQENRRSKSGSKDLLEGLSAYAKVQSDLQLTLAAHFRTIWQQPLHDAEPLPAQPSMAPQTSDSQMPHTQTMDLSNNEEDDEEDDEDGCLDDGAEDFEDLEVGWDGEEGNESETEGVHFYC